MAADGTLNEHNRLDPFQLIHLAPHHETILMSPAYPTMPRARYPDTAREMIRQQCLVFERAAIGLEERHPAAALALIFVGWNAGVQLGARQLAEGTVSALKQDLAIEKKRRHRLNHERARVGH